VPRVFLVPEQSCVCDHLFERLVSSSESQKAGAGEGRGEVDQEASDDLCESTHWQQFSVVAEAMNAEMHFTQTAFWELQGTREFQDGNRIVCERVILCKQ
jgi:hypothetical protein